jgi:succinate dehydrogenase/fumarate reductase flavoprotein subunit
MNTKTASNSKRLETYIVIMGGSGAGLAAAVAAGENGAKYVAEREQNVFQK